MSLCKNEAVLSFYGPVSNHGVIGLLLNRNKQNQNQTVLSFYGPVSDHGVTELLLNQNKQNQILLDHSDRMTLLICEPNTILVAKL